MSTLPELIAPIGTLWINAIRMTIIPLLLSLLITSIAGSHSKGILARLGLKTISLFILLIVLVCFYTVVLAPPLLALLNIDQATATNLLQTTNAEIATTSELPPFRDWLVNLVPGNLFLALAENAILSLLVFTLIFAFALTKIEESKRVLLVNFFSAIRDAMFVIIDWVMALAPIGIFALVFPLAADLGLTAVSALGGFIVITCSLITLATMSLYPLVVLAGGIGLQSFARTIAPVQVIGFSTRSSMVALPATIKAAESLNISSKLTALVLPVAVSLFKFASPIARTSGTYFIALLYDIDLSLSAMIVVALAIGLLSFYSPGIPSGGLLVMAPVYESLGLPVAGIGILIAVDLVVDMFITAANVTANVTVAALLARSEK